MCGKARRKALLEFVKMKYSRPALSFFPDRVLVLFLSVSMLPIYAHQIPSLDLGRIELITAGTATTAHNGRQILC